MKGLKKKCDLVTDRQADLQTVIRRGAPLLKTWQVVQKAFYLTSCEAVSGSLHLRDWVLDKWQNYQKM